MTLVDPQPPLEPVPPQWQLLAGSGHLLIFREPLGQLFHLP